MMENDKEEMPVEDTLSNNAKPAQNTDTSNSLFSIKKPYIPRGRPKSGRTWKEEKTRFSSIIKTRGIRLSLASKQKLRDDLKRVKEMSREIKAQREAEKEAKKQRRRDNLKRAEENNRKNEIVQVIKDVRKIKKMKKSQLRMIEKRDTLK